MRSFTRLRLRFRRLSVRARLLMLLFAITLASICLFRYVWFPRVEQIFVQSQTEEAVRQAEIIGDSLLPFLLNNQFGAVHETLTGIEVRHENWTGIKLVKSNGRLLYPLSPIALSVEGNQVFMQHDIRSGTEVLATLQAVIDMSAPIQRMNRELGFLGLAALLIVSGATLLLAYVIDRILSRRLQLLTRAARSMENGNFEAELPRHARDEIGALTRSFAQMRDKIHHQTRGLKRARREAEDALEAKSQFLATMSHEIRTPLNGVIPVAGLLLRSDLSKDQRQKVETIEESAQALQAIVDDVLDLAAFEGGHLEVQSLPLTLDKVGRSVLSILKAPADAKGLTLSIAGGALCTRTVMGDGQRIRQVLMNLVGNAIKFTERGGISVECHRVWESETHVLMQVEVKDTGMGIAPEDQARVFGRFEQAEGGRTRRFGGSGLGLAISKSIVEAHGGRIGLKSTVGEGSTFWFTLELAKPKPEELALIEEAHTVKPATGAVSDVDAYRNGGRILVAEDNEINRMVVTAMLEDAGVQVVTVNDGRAALKAARSQDWDLVLMDMHMPEMDGLEATREIRALAGQRGQVRIVALTASVLEDDARQCREAGMDDILTKPLSKQGLEQVLSEHLGVPSSRSLPQRVA